MGRKPTLWVSNCHLTHAQWDHHPTLNFQYNRCDVCNKQQSQVVNVVVEKTTWKIVASYLAVWASKKVLLIHMSKQDKSLSKCENILLVGK